MSALSMLIERAVLVFAFKVSSVSGSHPAQHEYGRHHTSVLAAECRCESPACWQRGRSHVYRTSSDCLPLGAIAGVLAAIRFSSPWTSAPFILIFINVEPLMVFSMP